MVQQQQEEEQEIAVQHQQQEELRANSFVALLSLNRSSIVDKSRVGDCCIIILNDRIRSSSSRR